MQFLQEKPCPKCDTIMDRRPVRTAEGPLLDVYECPNPACQHRTDAEPRALRITSFGREAMKGRI